MKFKLLYLTLISLMFIATTGFCQQDDFPDLSGPYFGLKPPGKIAEAFDPGIFIKGNGRGCSGFLYDGKVFVFTSMKPGGDWRLRPTMVTELKNGKWTKPEIAPFSNYAPYNFTVGPDGQTLWFTTLKSPNKNTSMLMEQANIWAVKLEMNGWTEPVMMGRSINTEKYYENYPAVTSDGTIYYMSRRSEGVGGTDVYKSRNNDGKYFMAENVGEPVNTAAGDADPFVAPDESYLIVCQKKTEGFGQYDLYISYRKNDGTWTKGINMGKNVNSSEYEFRPYVTPDGKYLFFTSNREPETSNIFWIDASIIEDLKPDFIK